MRCERFAVRSGRVAMQDARLRHRFSLQTRHLEVGRQSIRVGKRCRREGRVCDAAGLRCIMTQPSLRQAQRCGVPTNARSEFGLECPMMARKGLRCVLRVGGHDMFRWGGLRCSTFIDGQEG
jgi:hypothetical protein